MTDLRICKVCEIHVCFKWTKTTHVNDRPNMYIQGCVVNIEKADIYPVSPQHVSIQMTKNRDENDEPDRKLVSYLYMWFYLAMS